MNNKVKKSLIGVYKKCLTSMNRMYKLPLKKVSKGSNTNIVAKSTYNYMVTVQGIINDLNSRFDEAA